MQTGSRNSPEQEVVITRRRDDILTWSLRYDIVFGHDRSTSTCVDTVRLRRTQVQTGSENCTQTGNTNNLATKPHIDAISVAILMFCGQFFTGVYANRIRRLNASLTRKFEDGGRIPEVVITLRQRTISRWSQRLRHLKPEVLIS